ncbi:MAG TPA: hypothetical protein VEV63_06820 [Streptosporangiaceae bacterium]|nr:hypothetical protein [Streptosporangiaceae bacterium]
MNPRRHPWRIALVVVAALLAIPVAVVGIAWLAYNSEVTTDFSVTGGALVSANGRTVSVVAGALCDDTVNLTADEQPASVAITLHDTHPRVSRCSGMPGFAVYHVQLSQPLGRRRLLDGITGDRIPFFDVADVVRPAYIPPGYAFSYYAPEATELLSYGFPPLPRAAVCSQLYQNGSDLLVVTQGGTLLPLRSKPRRITVNGHPALEFPGAITWTAHGQRLTVSAQDLPSAQLIAVADSLPA